MQADLLSAWDMQPGWPRNEELRLCAARCTHLTKKLEALGVETEVYSVDELRAPSMSKDELRRRDALRGEREAFAVPAVVGTPEVRLVVVVSDLSEGVREGLQRVPAEVQAREEATEVPLPPPRVAKTKSCVVMGAAAQRP